MSNPIPIELKSITPFITRANELTKADPVISYWCKLNVPIAYISGDHEADCKRL